MSKNDDFNFDGDFGFDDSDSGFDDNTSDENAGNDGVDPFDSSDGSSNDMFDSDSGFGDSFNSGNTSSNNSDETSGDFGLTDGEDVNNKKPGAAKTAVIIVIIGVILLVIVLAISSLASKKSSSKGSSVSTEAVAESDNSADNVVNTVVKDTDWSSIDSDEKIEFSSDLKDLTFTVTAIDNQAKITNNEVAVRTELTGAISGLSGVYELYVPYNKGSKLSIGDSFSVKVQMGSYNGMTVVGDITY